MIKMIILIVFRIFLIFHKLITFDENLMTLIYQEYNFYIENELTFFMDFLEF